MSDTITKPAVKFSQTDLSGWVTTMTAEELTDLVPPRPPEQLSLFTETNRPITSRHLDSIEKFLEETQDWAIPTITLAAPPNTIRATRGQIELHPDYIKVLDGQHRIQAFANLIHELQVKRGEDDEKKDKLKSIKEQELPVAIFEVKNNRDQRQLFAWFARNKPIEAAVREYFDESDPFGKAAKIAMEDSKVLQGNVTYEKKTLGPKDRQLLTLSTLKDIATTIQLGTRRAAKAEDKSACWEQNVQDNLQKNLAEFFDDFLPGCGTNYEILKNPKDLQTNTIRDKSTSFALHPVIIRLIANVWARWTIDHQEDPKDLADCVANLKLRRADPLNDIEETLKLATKAKAKFPGLRDKAWEEATIHLIQEAKALGGN